MLPAGLRDLLPPEAEIESAVVDRLLAVFAAHGFARVAPPLVEFETSLLAGPGAAMAPSTFRLMDPVSQAMMGLSADITPQIARIATTRLVNEPRPLRLCYAGQVVRVRGGQLRPERQFGQVGAELFGEMSAAADAEIILLAAESLAALGISGLTIDINLPPLVPAVTAGLGMAAAAATSLREALDRKDAALVAQHAGPHAALFAALARAAGPAAEALGALEAIALPDAAAVLRHRLVEVVTAVLGDLPAGISLTVDPVEYHGFSYENGVSFAVFARGIRGELGRGGRYMAGRQDGRPGETATGFTLYADLVVRAAPESAPRPKVLVASGVARPVAAMLRQEGWITVASHAQPNAQDVLSAEARRQGCSHILHRGAAAPIPVTASEGAQAAPGD